MIDEIDVTECPDCSQHGRYEGRVLIGGRGFYTCPDGHRWQDVRERPSRVILRRTAPSTDVPSTPQGGPQ